MKKRNRLIASTAILVLAECRNIRDHRLLA